MSVIFLVVVVVMIFDCYVVVYVEFVADVDVVTGMYTHTDGDIIAVVAVCVQLCCSCLFMLSTVVLLLPLIYLVALSCMFAFVIIIDDVTVILDCVVVDIADNIVYVVVVVVGGCDGVSVVVVGAGADICVNVGVVGSGVCVLSLLLLLLFPIFVCSMCVALLCMSLSMLLVVVLVRDTVVNVGICICFNLLCWCCCQLC